MKIPKIERSAFALPTLLLITTILLLLATAIAKIGFSSMQVSLQDRDSDQALFAAEAGLVAAAEEVTRTGDLPEPFTAELPNGASYEVVFFKNETASPMTTVKGIKIPAGTAFLHATGKSAAGRTKHSGILLRVGLGLYRVGALGTEFDLLSSTFDSFSSETGPYPGSILEDAMIAASNETSGTIFDVSNSTIQGGIFVGPGADAGSHIAADADSAIARQGSLEEPLEVDDLKAPDIANADGDDDEDTGDQTFTLPGTDFHVTESDSVISLDLEIANGFHMTIQPNGDVFLDNFGGEEIGTGNLYNDQYGTITQPPDLDIPAQLGFADGGFVFQSRDLLRTVILSADGNLSVAYGGQFYSAKVPWIGGEAPSVTNPESLEQGRYDTVTIDSVTTALVSDTVIVAKNLNVSANGILALPPDAERVDIYVTESLTLEGEGVVVNNTRKPPKLNIFYLGDQPVQLNGGAEAYFTLFAPKADVSLAGLPDSPSEFFGALVGRQISVHNANFHFDQATLGIGQGVTGETFRVLARPRY